MGLVYINGYKQRYNEIPNSWLTHVRDNYSTESVQQIDTVDSMNIILLFNFN